ncbi:MAG: hypothetical protein HYS25_02215 [Ignavibacteriales bacterium]|nr:hypothetical protein [Ignavibacteriales bacterium]
MKRRLAIILGILATAVSIFGFTASNSTQKISECPLRGTPECPEYPACCK